MQFYFPVKYKLVLSILFALAWIGISLYLGRPWIADMEARFTLPVAWIIFTGLALLPGWANAFLIGGLLVDRRPQYRCNRQLPPVSILVAAYNEEKSIGETIDSILCQEYQGAVEIIVIDDGSNDATIRAIRQAQGRVVPNSNFHLHLICQPFNGGKAAALNAGLKHASHGLIVSLDADSYMYRESLARIVANLVDGPPNTAAVAGTVLVRNSRTNLLTRLQEWDYFLGIAVVKRIQSLFQGTLVAQGAFSVYRRDALERVHGWSRTVGEDIVLTWGFHELGYRVAYAENAFVFTNVPDNYPQFFRQRQRWARGLIEAIQMHPKVFGRLRMVTPFLYLNLLFPFLDFIFLGVFLPGIIAALFFKYYAVVGLTTLFLLPLTFLVNVVMFQRQLSIFRMYGLQVRKNVFGLLFYMLAYQFLMAPASLAGYLSEYFKLRKTWGTKPAIARFWPLLLLLPLLTPTAAQALAVNRVVAEYAFVADSDDEEHHGFYSGYLRRLESSWPSAFGLRAGHLEVKDPTGTERFDVLQLSWDVDLTSSLRLRLYGSHLKGDVWSPTLFSGSTVWVPASKWRLELSGERGIVDSVPGIRQRLYADTATVSADYLLTAQFTLVGALLYRWISDGNDRRGAIGRFVYTPERFDWFNLQLYGRKIDSDFRGVGYFSPGRMEEVYFLAGAARSIGAEDWVVRGQVGPGVQFIDGESKSVFRAEGTLRGWFTPRVGLESKIGFLNAQEAREAYRYWWGGASLVYAW